MSDRPRTHPAFPRAARLNDQEALQRCCLDECRGACCLHGVWVDCQQVVEILEAAEWIALHLPERCRTPDTWFVCNQVETDPYTPSGKVIPTRVLDAPAHYGGTACIFWRPEDAKCALQVASETAGLHPWHYKPWYCILHPLDIDEQGRLTLDTTPNLLAEPASCLRLAPTKTTLSALFAEELGYLSPEDQP